MSLATSFAPVLARICGSLDFCCCRCCVWLFIFNLQFFFCFSSLSLPLALILSVLEIFPHGKLFDLFPLGHTGTAINLRSIWQSRRERQAECGDDWGAEERAGEGKGRHTDAACTYAQGHCGISYACVCECVRSWKLKFYLVFSAPFRTVATHTKETEREGEREGKTERETHNKRTNWKSNSEEFPVPEKRQRLWPQQCFQFSTKLVWQTAAAKCTSSASNSNNNNNNRRSNNNNC